MRRLSRSPQAREDAKSILDYLSEHSVPAAERFARVLAARLKLAVSQPQIGRDRSDLRHGLRSFVVERYLIFYRFSETEVEVIRILHGSRNIEAEFPAGE